MPKKTENQKRLAKCISDINAAAEAATAENAKQTAFFTGEIKALTQEIKEQTAKRTEAAGKNDTAGFRAAAKNIASAEVEKKQYEDSLASFQKRPTITPAQAESFLHELQEIQRAINKDVTEEVHDLVMQIIRADAEAMQLQNDLIIIAQGLKAQSQGINETATGLSCNNTRVSTIIGLTNEYPWHVIADIVTKRANMLEFI